MEDTGLDVRNEEAGIEMIPLEMNLPPDVSASGGFCVCGILYKVAAERL